MKFLSKKTFSLAASAIVMAGVFASASAHHDSFNKKKALLDKDGDPVLARLADNCVITKWEGLTGECYGAIKGDATVYFDFDSAELDYYAKESLANLAKKVDRKRGKVEEVHIVGYADRIGDASYNKALSERRAKAVRSYLASKGIGTNTVFLKGKGEAASYGCQGKKGYMLISCLRKDRKVEIVIEYK